MDKLVSQVGPDLLSVEKVAITFLVSVIYKDKIKARILSFTSGLSLALSLSGGNSNCLKMSSSEKKKYPWLFNIVYKFGPGAHDNFYYSQKQGFHIR